MDYLSIQQRKAALDDLIYREVRRFEKDTGEVVSEVRVTHLDNRCTSVSVHTQLWSLGEQYRDRS